MQGQVEMVSACWLPLLCHLLFDDEHDVLFDQACFTVYDWGGVVQGVLCIVQLVQLVLMAKMRRGLRVGKA